MTPVSLFGVGPAFFCCITMTDTKPHRMTFLNRLYARLRELLAERGGLTDRDFKDAVKVARGHTGGKAKAEAMAQLLAAEGDPTGVAVVLPLPQELAQVLALDLVLARQFQRHHDFPEGVRALLIDKDRKPKWSCQDLTDVPREEIESHFR